MLNCNGKSSLAALAASMMALSALLSCSQASTVGVTPLGLASPAFKVTSTWSTGDVDTSGDVGQYTSLAFDPDDGYPAISYYYATGGDLKYAKWNGSSWNIQTVDSTDDIGQWTSLAFNSDGDPSIAYYDVTNGNLKWAFDDNDDGDFSDEGEILTVDSSADDCGKYASIDWYGSSKCGFTYYNDTDDDLNYAEYLVGLWRVSVPIDESGDVGKYCSFKFDPDDGTPTVSYYDATNGNLKFAYEAGRPLTWYPSNVDTTNDVGQWTSLAYDGEGYPSIGYYDVTNANVKWAWNEDGGGWDIYTVNNSANDVGKYLSHDWYSTTKAGFSYYDDTGDDLYYSQCLIVLWQISSVEVDATNDVGRWTSTKYNSSGSGRISYYYVTGGDLRFAEWSD